MSVTATPALFWCDKPCTTPLFWYRELWQLCVCYVWSVLCAIRGELLFAYKQQQHVCFAFGLGPRSLTNLCTRQHNMISCQARCIQHFIYCVWEILEHDRVVSLSQHIFIPRISFACISTLGLSQCCAVLIAQVSKSQGLVNRKRGGNNWPVVFVWPRIIIIDECPSIGWEEIWSWLRVCYGNWALCTLATDTWIEPMVSL